MTFGLVLLALVFATGLPLVCAFIALMNVRRYRVKAHPCESHMVPADVRRRMAPWLNRMGHFGFRQAQVSRLESAGFAEAHRWILVNDEERTYATLERTVPVSGAGPRVNLSLFTPLRDGTLIVTLDHRLTRHPPSWWRDVQRHFGTVTAQWKHHYARIRGDQGRIIPPMEKFTEMLAADEEARHAALVSGGEFTPTSQDPDVLRLRLTSLPARVLPILGDFFRGRYFRSTTRRDVAAPAKAKPDENERVGGAVGLSLNQAVEQDLTRYRALQTVGSSPLDYFRRLVLLAGTVALFIFLFGQDQPLQTALTVIVLSALHEAGHWLPMRLFGYRGIPPVFVPFMGATERGRKLHAPAWQQLVVALGGPLPGLIAGLAMLAHGYFRPDTPLWLLDAAGMAVALNALHLLPVLPMDGGKIIDLLVFRDLPLLRPFFTITSSISAFAAALALRSRVLKHIAMLMLGGVIWDVRTIQVVRGARKLPWAGEVNDEGEALRRIFRGLRQEGHGSFIGSDGWHKKIEALLLEVMRKRPSLATRFAGGSLLLVSGAMPCLLFVGVLLGPVLGDAGRVVRTAEHVTEFRKNFPKENRTLSPEDRLDLVSLAGETEKGPDGTPYSHLDQPRKVAAEVTERIGPRIDKIDWQKAAIASRTNVIGAQILPIWVEVQVRQLEQAANESRKVDTLHRADKLLQIFSEIEPATSLERREAYTQAELRVLRVVERESASGHFDETALALMIKRISDRHAEPNPEIEGLLLVAAWAERTRLSATSDAAAQASLDPRFWRDLYPRIRTVRRLLAEQNNTLVPASVALARHWRTTRRVGELPPQMGVPVMVSAGEATLILDFCEQHRQLTWRRLSALSALRLEEFRQRKGEFPKMGYYTLPGGAVIELQKPKDNDGGGPHLRLTDRRDQISLRIPTWLAPATLPVPPTAPPLDYDCPLFGSKIPPELSELSHNW